MGIVTALETEDGRRLETIEDPTNVLHRLLPDAADPRYQCVTRIDWYGDTVFNHLQAPQLLAEWPRLEDPEPDMETTRVVEGIRRLVERLRDENHVYLKFYGD